MVGWIGIGIVCLFIFLVLFIILKKNTRPENRWVFKRWVIVELWGMATVAMIPICDDCLHLPYRVGSLVVALSAFALVCYGSGIFTEIFAKANGKNAKWFMLAIYAVGTVAIWLIKIERTEKVFEVITGALFIGALIVHFWAVDNLKRKQKLKGEEENGKH